MRRVLILLLVMVSVAVVGCSSSNDSGSGQAGSAGDPLNAKVELGRSIDQGYDRDDWDPAALAAATAVAARVQASTVGCVDPGALEWPDVLSTWQRVNMPMPGAVVQCFSNDDEDITVTAFVDEDHMQTYIEAKAELICGRALAPLEPGGAPSNFNGLIYIDMGDNILVEPDSNEVRDQLVAEIGGTPGKMCPDGVDPTTSSAG